MFLGFPVLTVIQRSFVDNLTGETTLLNYARAFTTPRYTNAMRNSVLFAGACTLVAAIAGTFVGLVASRLPQAAKSAVLSILSLPLTLSGLVVAFSFIVLMGRNGIVNLLLRRILGLQGFSLFNLYSWQGLLLVYAFFNIPLMTLTMAAVFGNLDRDLLEAARNAGARPWQTWVYVIIPVLAPGFVTGISIVFAGMMGAFGTALALTGMAKNLLALQIYSHTSESAFNLPQASALAAVLASMTTTSLWVIGRLGRRVSQQNCRNAVCTEGSTRC